MGLDFYDSFFVIFESIEFECMKRNIFFLFMRWQFFCLVRPPKINDNFY